MTMLPYRLAPLSVLAAAIVFLFVILPLGTETVTYGTLSPDSLPKWLTYAIIVLALIDLVFPSIPPEAPLPRGAEVARAGFIFAVTLGAVYLMPHTGFLLPAMGLALVTVLLTGERRVPWLILTTVVLPVLIWFLVTGPLERVLP